MFLLDFMLSVVLRQKRKKMQENTDQENSKYEHILRSVHYYYSFQNLLRVLGFKNWSFPFFFFAEISKVFTVKQNPITIVKMWCIFLLSFQ